MPARASIYEDKVLDLEALLQIASSLALTAERYRSKLDADMAARSGIRLVGADTHDVWILRWPPGAAVTPHDHGSSNAGFVVATGTLREVRWSDGARTEQVLRHGEGTTVEAGMVHDVVALDEEAVSVHVYSPPLSRMAYFDDKARVVVFEEELDPDLAHFVAKP